MNGGGCGHGWVSDYERNEWIDNQLVGHGGSGYHDCRVGHGYHSDRGGHGNHTDRGGHGNHTDPGGHGCHSDHGCSLEGGGPDNRAHWGSSVSGMDVNHRGENESHKNEDRDCWIGAGACHALGKECADDMRRT